VTFAYGILEFSNVKNNLRSDEAKTERGVRMGQFKASFVQRRQHGI